MCAAVDAAISLSTHSLLPMVAFVDHVEHAAPSASKVVDDGEAPVFPCVRPWTTARPRRWEDAGVESQTERCTRVNWF